MADVGLVRLIAKFNNSGRQLGTDYHQDLMRMVVSTFLSDDLQGCSGFHGLMHSCSFSPHFLDTQLTWF